MWRTSWGLKHQPLRKGRRLAVPVTFAWFELVLFRLFKARTRGCQPYRVFVLLNWEGDPRHHVTIVKRHALRSDRIIVFHSQSSCPIQIMHPGVGEFRFDMSLFDEWNSCRDFVQVLDLVSRVFPNDKRSSSRLGPMLIVLLHSRYCQVLKEGVWNGSRLVMLMIDLSGSSQACISTITNFT